jgi:hypothetical protein
MKKFLVLSLVLAIVSAASAASVDLVIDSVISGTQLPDYQGLPSYMPSTWLKIGFVTTGFPSTLPDGVFGLETDITGTGGMAANPGFSSVWEGLCDEGVPGAAPNLLTDMDLNHGTAVAGVPNGTLLGWIEFHVPDVDASTIITIRAANFRIHNAFNITLTNYDGPEALLLHVAPEPMTMALLGLGGLFLRRRYFR